MAKFTINNEITREQKTINVSYVWDREDKYLVITDDVEKKKYIADTWYGGISDDNVWDLCQSFAKVVLNWAYTSLSYHGKGKPNKACHNDDFYHNYKKNYELVPCQVSGLRY